MVKNKFHHFFSFYVNDVIVMSQKMVIILVNINKRGRKYLYLRTKYNIIGP